jgi:hypothetical protein
MQSDYSAGAAGIVMLVPYMIIQLLYAIVVFQLCRKQNWNAWLWTIATLVPVIGLIVFAVLFISSLLKTLDRLNALERNPF